MAKTDQQKPLNDVVRDIIRKMQVATDEGSEAHGDEFHSVHHVQLKRLGDLMSPSVGIALPTGDEMEQYFRGVVGIVTCSDEERFMIWRQNDDRKKSEDGIPHKTWTSSTCGFMFTVGHLAHYPVCVQTRVDVIDGAKILFVDACSRVVDHDMVRAWCKKIVQAYTDLPNDTIFPNATNWHNALPRKEAVCTN